MNSNIKILLSFKTIGFVLTIIFCVSFCSLAKGQKADSLMANLKAHPQNDTARVKLLYEIAGIYKDKDLDSMGGFAKEGLSIAEKINFEKGKAFCSQQLGLVYLRKNRYDSALNYCQNALNFYEKTHNIPGKVKVLLSIGDIYYRQTKYNSSLEYYNKIITLCEEINDLTSEGLALIDIGGIYSDQSNYAEAINYYLKGLKVFEKQNDRKGISMTLVNIATIYAAMGNYKLAIDYINQSIPVTKGISDKEVIFSNIVNIGAVYEEMKDFKNALIAYDNGLKLVDSLGDKTWKNVCLVNIANTYFQMGELDTAYVKYIELLKQDEELNDTASILTANAAIGSILIKKGKLREGIKQLLPALNIAKGKQIKQTVFEIARDLSTAYEQLHDYPHSLEYHKIFYNYRDSLYNEKNDKQIQQLQYDYALEKKEIKIQILEKHKLIEQNRSEKQRLIIWGMLSGLLLFIIIIILLYRNRLYEKKNTDKILKQKEEIQLQASKLEELNGFKDKTFSVLTHDLRGPLASLTAMMTMLDESVISMDDFKALIPDVNKQLYSLNILLDNLLYWAKSYMKGEMAAKPEIINLYNITSQNITLLHDEAHRKEITINNNISPDIHAFCDKEQIDIVIRNLIMNAIKFTYHNGLITVNSKVIADTVQLSITDNGVGMSQKQLDKLFTTSPDNNTYGTEGEKGTGLGLLLCHGFIKVNNGSITAISEMGKGSRFTVILPMSPTK